MTSPKGLPAGDGIGVRTEEACNAELFYCFGKGEEVVRRTVMAMAMEGVEDGHGKIRT